MPKCHRTPVSVVPTVAPHNCLSPYIIFQLDIPHGAVSGRCDDRTIFMEYLDLHYGDSHVIYTDGSRVTEDQVSTASGMYCSYSKLGVSWRLNPGHSVMGAELFAILQALKLAQESPLQSVVIFTDSRSSLELVLGIPKTYKSIAFEIQKLLVNLNREKNVHLHWVKAHCGIPGNETADKLANIGHMNDKSVLFPLSLEERLIFAKSSIPKSLGDHLEGDD